MTETTEPTVAAAQPETKTPETATTPAAEGDSAPAVATVTVEGKTNGEASPEAEAAAATAEEEAKEEKEPVKEMRAVVLTGFGGFKGVKIQKKPEPTAQAGEVLIRVRAW